MGNTPDDADRGYIDFCFKMLKIKLNPLVMGFPDVYLLAGNKTSVTLIFFLLFFFLFFSLSFVQSHTCSVIVFL